MKSPYKFIVEPIGGKRYDNVKKVGDSELIISSDIEDFRSAQRIAVVKATPINYNGPIKAGSLVVVHHNVFRLYFGQDGNKKYSSAFFKDDMFFVQPDRIYLYKNDWSQDWQSLNPWCFVSPIVNDDDWVNDSKKEYWGIVKYANDSLEGLGVNVGDTVSYQPDTEYEFTIDDELMYRMYTRNICLKK
jgi:hypothetical protein